MTSNKTPVGYEFPPQEVAWLKRDLLLFANTIGCEKDELNFLFELHPEFAAFPTYPVVLPFKLTDQEVSDTVERIKRLQSPPGAPPIDVGHYVDAERYITLLKPLPVTSAGRSFTLNQKCRGIYDQGAHTVQAFETSLVDAASGEIYASFTNTGLALGQGGWGGPKGAESASVSIYRLVPIISNNRVDLGPAPTRFPPPDTRLADQTIEMNLRQNASLLYRLNGDYHPHNVDANSARRTGFSRPFHPGLGTWNLTAHALLRALCSSDPTRLGAFGARFTGVVFPGDRLLLELWLLRPGEMMVVDGGGGGGEGGGRETSSDDDDDGDDGEHPRWDEVRFRVVVGGKAVLSDGRAVVRVKKRVEEGVHTARNEKL